MYGKCGRCEFGDRYANGWCLKFSSRPDSLGGHCEGECHYFDNRVSKSNFSEGLANPTPTESVEIWSDMIAEAKDRGAVGDLSSIAHRLILIAATGGFKAH